jgi:predicted flap endonuclease-1-like 5' DNA nuclease
MGLASVSEYQTEMIEESPKSTSTLGNKSETPPPNNAVAVSAETTKVEEDAAPAPAARFVNPRDDMNQVAGMA